MVVDQALVFSEVVELEGSDWAGCWVARGKVRVYEVCRRALERCSGGAVRTGARLYGGRWEGDDEVTAEGAGNPRIHLSAIAIGRQHCLASARTLIRVGQTGIGRGCFEDAILELLGHGECTGRACHGEVAIEGVVSPVVVTSS